MNFYNFSIFIRNTIHQKKFYFSFEKWIHLLKKIFSIAFRNFVSIPTLIRGNAISIVISQKPGQADTTYETLLKKYSIFTFMFSKTFDKS